MINFLKKFLIKVDQNPQNIMVNITIYLIFSSSIVIFANKIVQFIECNNSNNNNNDNANICDEQKGSIVYGILLVIISFGIFIFNKFNQKIINGQQHIQKLKSLLIVSVNILIFEIFCRSRYQDSFWILYVLTWILMHERQLIIFKFSIRISLLVLQYVYLITRFQINLKFSIEQLIISILSAASHIIWVNSEHCHSQNEKMERKISISKQQIQHDLPEQVNILNNIYSDHKHNNQHDSVIQFQDENVLNFPQLDNKFSLQQQFLNSFIYSVLKETIMQGIMIFDEKLNIIYSNNKVINMFSCSNQISLQQLFLEIQLNKQNQDLNNIQNNEIQQFRCDEQYDQIKNTYLKKLERIKEESVENINSKMINSLMKKSRDDINANFEISNQDNQNIQKINALSINKYQSGSLVDQEYCKQQHFEQEVTFDYLNNYQQMKINLITQDLIKKLGQEQTIKQILIQLCQINSINVTNPNISECFQQNYFNDMLFINNEANEIILNYLRFQQKIIKIRFLPYQQGKQNGSSSPTIILVICEELDQQYQKDEQYQKEEKLSIQFKKILTSLSHKLRTPLNCSMNMLQLMIEEENINSYLVSNYIQPALSSNLQLHSFINDICDSILLCQGQFKLHVQSFNLEQLLKECLFIFQLVASTKSIGLEMQYDIKIPDNIHSDPIRIRQVVINLISNAIKFSNQGQIIIYTKLIDALKVIKVTVQDQGIGLSPEQQLNLFQQDNNIRPDSSRIVGLGLQISNQISKFLTKDQGILVQSEINVGSSFSFFIQTFDSDDSGLNDCQSFWEFYNKLHSNETISSELRQSNEKKLYKQVSINTIPGVLTKKQSDSLINRLESQKNLYYEQNNGNNDIQSLKSINCKIITRTIKSSSFQQSIQQLSNNERHFSFDKQISDQQLESCNIIEQDLGIQQQLFTLNPKFYNESMQISKIDQNLLNIPSKDQINLLESQRIVSGQSQNQISSECLSQNSQKKQKKIQNQLKNSKNSFDQLKMISKTCECSQILIVDDEMYNILAIKMMIKQYNQLLICDSAINGQEAVDKVKQRLNYKNMCCKNYDVIFMDIDMPIMNGYQACKELLALYKEKQLIDQEIPVICISSANVSDQDKKEAQKEGIQYFLDKPINKQKLYSFLNKLSLKTQWHLQ